MQQNLDAIYRNSYSLDKGYVYFSRTPVKIRVVLGSCVSVCLWDKESKFGCMNHFMHPLALKSSKATPKFGNAAMIAMFRIMEEAGSKSKNLIAQIFGGGKPEHHRGDDVGAENVAVARKYLKKKGIKIVSEDVGGSLGRKIVFDTATGQAAVLKVEDIRNSDWFY